MAIAVYMLNKKVKSYKYQVYFLLIFILNLLHYMMHYRKKWPYSFFDYMPSYVAIQIHLSAANLPHSWAATPQYYFSFPTLFGTDTFIHVYEAISWGRLEVGKAWSRY